MVRKCGSCGFPAPDGESKFCNRCGTEIVDETEPRFPVCGTCGARVADPEAQFCDKCGGPVRKAMACPSCGNPAIDENSKFCTRCGTTFVKPGTCPSCGFASPDDKAVFCNRCGASLRNAGTATAPAVVITKKRTTLPVQEEPVADWDPWSDGSPDYEAQIPAPPETLYTGPPPVSSQQESRAPQISIPPKKYSHLPLIADELKGTKKPLSSSDNFPESAQEKHRTKKKGVLGFLKR